LAFIVARQLAAGIAAGMASQMAIFLTLWKVKKMLFGRFRIQVQTGHYVPGAMTFKTG
jgi:hypothetical protein